MFKTLPIVLALFLPYSSCISDEMKELAAQLHNACVAETGATEDAITNARAGTFADDDNFKCYFKCLFDQMAIMDDEGIIDVEAMIAVLPDEYQDTLPPVIRKCDTKKGANPCENAWLTHKCYYQENPAHYFLI
uniref:Odorant binding protein 11 n=1 Tax=Rhynchophorus ferrugineus TaxID=354439 RepID=A0A1C8K2S9_RHYFE|nr:odorant binding protein 11 [Rhynchophorus ferrugineus]